MRRLIAPAWRRTGAMQRRFQSSTGVPASLAPIPPVGQRSGIVVSGPSELSANRVKVLPLTLVEELPQAPAIVTEIELLMRAWCEEHARELFRFTLMMRAGICFIVFTVGYFAYKMWVVTDRRIRGADVMPSGLRIGAVVYLDMAVNGIDAGRLVIGLLTENCPLYCEYFHRRCTGNGGSGNLSFRGQKLQSLIVRNAAIFGDGPFMHHDVPGYHPEYLPTEYKAEKPWRGALSSIAYGPNRESPNFAIHMCSGDFSPQVFGLVVGGYEILERMTQMGTSHGCEPRQEWTVEGCGELCTLDKTKIVPMPWRLYESVSVGYDEEKFGKLAKPVVPQAQPADASVSKGTWFSR